MKPSHRNVVLQKKDKTRIYNRGPALQNWDAKLANIQAGNNDILDVAIIGDSISEGFINNASLASLLANSFKWKLTTYFNNKYDDVGRGHIPNYYPSSGGDAGSLHTYTETWSGSAYSFAAKSTLTTVNGATCSFTFNGTGCDIWVNKGTGLSNINVSVDGGAPSNYDLTTTPTTLPYVLTIASSLENTSHTVTITNMAAKNLRYSGFIEKKGTRGVRVHMTAKSGGGSSSFTNATSNLPWFTALAPDLAVFNIGVNDHTSNVVPATFKSNMQTLITHLKGLGCDVIVGTDGTDDRTDDGATPYTYGWYDYVAAMKDVALSNNCCFIDTDRQWGGPRNARQNDLIPVGSATDIHPTIAGHNQIYEVLRDVIDPT